MDLKKLGEILKESREEKRLSMREAARQLNMSHSYLGKIEKAFNPVTKLPIKPSIEVLESFSRLYDLKLDMLLELAGYTVDLDDLYGISREELPTALTDIGVEYIALAKEIKDKEIPIEKIKQLIALLDK